MIVHYNSALHEEEFQPLIIVALFKVKLKILNPVNLLKRSPHLLNNSATSFPTSVLTLE